MQVIYFNLRGRAEVLRLLLSALNEKYDDERLSGEQWGQLKPSMKYGQLPVLTLESGEQMNESMAIARYLARKGKLHGKNEWETYLIDRAIDTVGFIYISGVIYCSVIR